MGWSVESDIQGPLVDWDENKAPPKCEACGSPWTSIEDLDYGNGDEPYLWCHTCNYAAGIPYPGLSWNPGTNGKGIVFNNGEVHTWPIDDDDAPHHGYFNAYTKAKGGTALPFNISPEGKVYAEGHGGIGTRLDAWDLARKAEPRLWSEIQGTRDESGFGHGQNVLDILGPQVPPKTTKIGSTTVSWWEGKPGDAVVMAEGGSPEDRYLAEQIVSYQLAAVGYKRAQFTFEAEHKTAGWPDIMQKAKRLIQSGNVTLLRNGWNNIVAHVIGDHGEYTSEIGRDDPESRSITTWQCECPWDQYAWQRTRKWKKYEGRPCAHVLAAFWKSQGTPLDEGPPEGQNLPPGQKGGPPPAPAPSTPALPTGTGMPKPEMPSPSVPRSFGPEEALGESAPMAPPGEGPLPTPPIDQLAEQMPPVPGQTPGGMPANPSIVSVPGAKMPTPFNPIQFPGGTYSSAPEEPPNYREGTEKERCGNCKMNNEGLCWGYGNKEIEADYVCDSWYPESKQSKTAAEEFIAPEIVRLKNDGYGIAEGKSEDHGAGQFQNIPAGKTGEVLGQDPSTGWVEVIFPLHDAGVMEPYHVKMFCDPSELEHTETAPPGPFIRRRQ